MKIRCHSSFTATQWLLLAVSAGMVVIPLVIATQYVLHKHEYLKTQLQEIAPRYARLLALEQQKDALAQALQSAVQLKEKSLYPAQGDAAQIGNNVQSQLREALIKAGLLITTNQVKVEKAKPDDREYIQVHMAAEGNMEQVQLAMIGVEAIRPRVWLEQIRIAHRGSLLTADPKVTPGLNVRMLFSIPRSKEGE